jgi:hypothetical protein
MIMSLYKLKPVIFSGIKLKVVLKKTILHVVRPAQKAVSSVKPFPILWRFQLKIFHDFTKSFKPTLFPASKPNQARSHTLIP